ncbi:hypothetical protein DCAR_0935705 [Daucus carota subsp. sativus]|uniref:C2H2-type domain-containing protein n=1 Tax=Daucus carota subsp. sativus TaxID=79200 RepID=A0A175YJY3_DAUCS|nr:PREDICTED: transcriptional regulator SUPERMAN-like [Daucus carota subsp. sativus]WOH16156.1 hypothetical protein DCAR_0935705 [Daucus carota subsp. sativus]
MDCNKQGNFSETSSDENDNVSSQRLKGNDKATAIGRFYECTFCKRGFTNAQALGGHMNIHRKDKAKSKPKSGAIQTSNSKSTAHDFDQVSNSSMYLVPITNEHAHYQANMGGTLMNYQFYLPMPVPSCPPQYAYYNLTDSIEHVASSRDLKMQEEVLETDLSLEVLKEKSADEAVDRIEHEVDLELRLGHDPGLD